MKIKGFRVLESTLTKSQQPNLMLITHILRFSHTNLRYALHCFKNHLNQEKRYGAGKYSPRRREAEATPLLSHFSSSSVFLSSFFLSPFSLLSFPSIYRLKLVKCWCFCAPKHCCQHSFDGTSRVLSGMERRKGLVAALVFGLLLVWLGCSAVQQLLPGVVSKFRRCCR
jgi:hypothetical protein